MPTINNRIKPDKDGTLESILKGKAVVQQRLENYANPDFFTKSLTDDDYIRIGQEGTQDIAARTVGGTIKDVGITAAKGVVGLGEAAVGLADIATGGHAGKAMEDYLGYDAGATQAFLGEFYSDAQKEAFSEAEKAKGFWDTTKAMLENPSTIAHALIESGPQMLGSAAMARKLLTTGLLKSSPAWRGILAAAAGEGAVSAGATAEGIRTQTEDGLLTAKQSAISVASGFGTGMFAVVGGRVSNKLGIGDIDVFLSGGSTATAKGIIKRIIGGGISEGAFEELPQSMQEQVWLNAAMDKPLLDGVAEAGAAGLITGAVMGGGFGALQAKTEPVEKKEETAKDILLDETVEKQKATARDILTKKRDPISDEQLGAESLSAEEAAAAFKAEELEAVAIKAKPEGVEPPTKAKPAEAITPQKARFEKGWDTTPSDEQEDWDRKTSHVESIVKANEPEKKKLKEELAVLKSSRKKPDIARKKVIKEELDELKAQELSLLAGYEEEAISAETALVDEAREKAKAVGVREDDLDDFTEEFGLQISQERPYIETNYNKTMDQIFSEVVAEYLPEKPEALGRRKEERPDTEDRRVDIPQRKRIADMTPDEMRKELLVNPVTNIPNKRAMKEKEQEYLEKGEVSSKAYLDVDSLKFVNDLGGHAAGDELLNAVAKTLEGISPESYHISGDEFIILGKTDKEVGALAKALNDKLAETEIEFTNTAGEVFVYKGMGVSYGIHKEEKTADELLRKHKEERETAGLRAERGERPPGLREKDTREARVSKGEVAKGKEIDVEAQKAATSKMNDLPEPTEAQIEAGTYKKGHVKVQGFDISIENPDKSQRAGTSETGKKWSITMAGHYGYFKRSEGKDGEQIDVFVNAGNRRKSDKSYIVDQVDPKSGKFDEHKVMLGYNSLPAATEGYLANYEKGWKGLGNITAVEIEELKEFVGKKQRTPFKPIKKEKVAEPTQEQVVSEDVRKADKLHKSSYGLNPKNSLQRLLHAKQLYKKAGVGEEYENYRENERLIGNYKKQLGIDAEPVPAKVEKPKPPEATEETISKPSIPRPAPEVATIPKEEKIAPEKQDHGYANVEGKQKPILSAREITKGKKKGKYEIVLTAGRDADGKIIPGKKKIVDKKAITEFPALTEETKAKEEPVAEKEPIKKPISPEDIATAKEWDSLDSTGKESLAKRVGWVTKAGELTGKGKEFAATSWADLTSGAQNAIKWRLSQDKTAGLMAKPKPKAPEIKPKVPKAEAKPVVPAAEDKLAADMTADEMLAEWDRQAKPETPEAKKIEVAEIKPTDTAVRFEGIDLSKITVEVSAIRESTGEKVKIKQDAKTALAEVDANLEQAYSLRACIE